MENVTIVGTESGALILATESGQRFVLPIDEVLRREIRRASRDTEATAAKLAASPRDIQTQIRAGLSAAETAELLGVSVQDVERFEGPVLAEHEHIIGQALAVPVLIGSEVEPDAQPTFGTAISAKLGDLDASEVRWASWKGESGWMLKLEFVANEVSHDARWSFDPRRSTLAPLNADATQLSRQGSLPEGLIPRLRAVESPASSPYKDDSRFDPGTFALHSVDSASAPEDAVVDAPRSDPAIQDAAARRAPEESHTGAETADLLEALRRRRGQREPAPVIEPEDERDSGLIALFEGLGDDADDESLDQPEDSSPASNQDAAPEPASGRRKRRNALPSWDEIVFGARTDE